MLKIDISRKASKNDIIRNISLFVNGLDITVEKDTLKQMLLELVINAKKYGKGNISICNEKKEGQIIFIIENGGGFFINKSFNNKRLNKEVQILKQIFSGEDKDSYGLNDIIDEVIKLSGYVLLESHYIKLRFYDAGKHVAEKSTVDESVKIQICFYTESAEKTFRTSESGAE